MEEQWVIDRARLRSLLSDHPDWTLRQYMTATGRSRKWVQKWRRRLRAVDPDDQQVLYSQSHARKTPCPAYHPDVIRSILDLRDHPPGIVPRKLGAPTILYFLQDNQELKAQGHRLPRSTSTIWKILDAHQRILRKSKVEHIPFDRPTPMDTWEIDFTDVPGIEASHDKKRAHQVETFAVVDRGTSILVDLQVSDNYQASSALIAMASTLIQQGRPRCVVFDRDPRFVGSWSAEEFPSAFMRFLLCLGIEIAVCPPQRPDLKPFVERYFRTFNEECVQVSHPANLQQARQVFDEHRYTYNHLRPNQSKVCGNRPPYQAFPRLPRLAHIPQMIDPDRWLLAYHNRLFKRRVDHSGRIQINKQRYYVQRELAGRYVVVKLDAHRRVLEMMSDGKLIKTLAIKGLYGEPIEFGDYLEMMRQDAEAEQRRLARNRRLGVA